MTPIKNFPSWHYSLYSDLLKGHRMDACSAKYSVSEAQICNIFYAVTREAKGLPQLPVKREVLDNCGDYIFSIEEIDDESDQPTQ